MSIPGNTIPLQKRTSRLNALQSFRGIAAFAVIINHILACYPTGNTVTDSLFPAIANSHAAVVVFFVLSGFVLSFSLEKCTATVSDVISFYIKRIFRILPLLIVITALSILYTLAPISTRSVSAGNSFLSGLMEHGPLISQVAVIKCFLGLASHYVPQNWTLTTELLVALVFPFFFFISRKDWNWFFCLLLLTLTLSFVATYQSGGVWLPAIYTVDFVIGIGCYRLWQERGGVSHSSSSPVFLIGLAALLLGNPLVHIISGTMPSFHSATVSLIEALAAAMMIFELASGRGMHRFLERPSLVYLGNISYGLYITHFLVLVILARLMNTFLLSVDPAWRWIIMSISVNAVTVVLAACFYPLIELPFNRLGKIIASNVANWTAPKKKSFQLFR
ncbi:acyltransferase family protein [Acetobacter musti]|uniref:Acyltransferase family protein n=1 Tax=Acetobacter musti TaxID=864732 RepID=A0ABX0JTY1_9PROT|nr:acyltransferase [Acetobacter musti]NHN86963.1 acyltransferase family protein [Acetobacter musti]